jgi:hypothetical protein
MSCCRYGPQDAGQERFGLDSQDIILVNKILQHLRDKFRGGGCVWLMKIQRRVFNISGGAPVMVDDGHMVAG